MQTEKPNPLSDWAGNIGDQYFERNPVTKDGVLIREAWLHKVLSRMGFAPQSVLEIGAGQGDNLVALRKLLPDAQLAATEPNRTARDMLRAIVHGCTVTADAAQDLSFVSNECDLVFTNGCLIHVSPEERHLALNELYRVSKRWILICEYFAAKDEHVPWRGSHIWKCDFGAEMMKLQPTLTPVACEFEWKHLTGMDHATWWLFRKNGAAA
jgi:pseudaminic acid biosynthesis-associated methylase